MYEPIITIGETTAKYKVTQRARPPDEQSQSDRQIARAAASPFKLEAVGVEALG